MKKLILVLIFTLALYASALAQSNFTDDTFVITTYYPAPYGVYRNMRLQPSDLPEAGVGPGVMYYNQTEDMMKFFNGSTWLNMAGDSLGAHLACGLSNGKTLSVTPTLDLCSAGNVPSPVSISGSSWSWTCGTYRCSASIGFYTPQIFTTVGTTIWTVPPGATLFNVLVVGGGGGGSGRFYGGGGGGGGINIATRLVLSPGQQIPITVGAGGAKGVADVRGSNGGYSAFGTSIIAPGGGGGSHSGSPSGIDGQSGGSGGGGGGMDPGIGFGGRGSPGYGNDGGQGFSGTHNCLFCCGGGGGGAGSVGGDGTKLFGGNGGNGRVLNFSGADVTYAGGGGGGTQQQPQGAGGSGGGGEGATGGGAATAGTNGLGGGGGGGGYYGSEGAAGGSGIVIVVPL